MARKKERNAIVYGSEKQTIPVFIQDERYRALKSLALQKGQPLNQLVRDIIEEVYGEELDTIEGSIILRSRERESSQMSEDALNWRTA